MGLEIRAFREEDLAGMVTVWNEVVEAGNAFPQIETLTVDSAREFFGSQTETVVAVIGDRVFGLYILHPNNIGRCAHIANASYAVASYARGQGLGRELVKDSLTRARKRGFTGLQFNAVVDSNKGAMHLYEDLGFTHVGIIPGGYAGSMSMMGTYEDIHIYYHSTRADAPLTPLPKPEPEPVPEPEAPAAAAPAAVSDGSSLAAASAALAEAAAALATASAALAQAMAGQDGAE